MIKHTIHVKCDFCKKPFSLEVNIKHLPYVFKYEHRCFNCDFLNEVTAEFNEPFIVTEVVYKTERDKARLSDIMGWDKD